MVAHLAGAGPDLPVLHGQKLLELRGEGLVGFQTLDEFLHDDSLLYDLFSAARGVIH